VIKVRPPDAASSVLFRLQADLRMHSELRSLGLVECSSSG
jgi:hypothetical protein